jgi:hypothetical protein
VTMTHPISTIGCDGAGAVSANESLVHPASTVGCSMSPMLGCGAVATGWTIGG